jgi:hypothetical protein
LPSSSEKKGKPCRGEQKWNEYSEGKTGTRVMRKSIEVCGPQRLIPGNKQYTGTCELRYILDAR